MGYACVTMDGDGQHGGYPPAPTPPPPPPPPSPPKPTKPGS